MKLKYADIFYSHRPDPDTPLEETMMALDHAVRSGRALYAGISNYRINEAKQAIEILKSLGTPCLIHQPKYSMFVRWVEEEGLLNVLEENGVGCIPFSPLAQGLLTDKYLHGIPKDSRAAKPHGFLQEHEVSEERIAIAKKLNQLAKHRSQSLSQMALAWLLKDKRVTTVLIGVSSVEQLENNLACLINPDFMEDELAAIEKILKGE
jgi:L-glyceraldehyde 3-phosphate reductase